VELFHLLFLRQLAAAGDRTHFTVKGGCNLRFFFGSIRYSEDLDLDVAVVAPTTLKNKVERLLASPGLGLQLKACGIELIETSAPKQTDTTQRWKMGLAVEGQSQPLRTKVEFSRRNSNPSTAVSPVDPALSRAYGLTPPLVQHYTADAALIQKVEALVGRAQPQARDVFDLQLLRAKVPRLPKLKPALRAQLPEAMERIVALSFDDFSSQVAAYLSPDQARAFADEASWEAQQSQVIELLELLSR
jgi:predicted nucleotidyltransferase component of viral defense system